MVITTHMYNQIIQAKQKKSKNDTDVFNLDSALIKSFLNDSTNFSKTEESVISSNS